MNSVLFEIKTAGEMRKLGEIMGKAVFPGSVICLIGELGTGKTTLVQGISKGLGVNSYVNSPTFTIIKEYEGDLRLFHIDVYRLEDPEEILFLGVEEYIYGEGLTVIEWADKIYEFLPPDFLEVTLNREKEEARRVNVKSIGKKHYQVVEELKKYADFSTG